MSVLIESSIRAALLAGAVAAIFHALRIRDPRARHAGWRAVLAAMLLLPAWTAWGPTAPLRVLPGSAPAVSVPEPSNPLPAPAPAAVAAAPVGPTAPPAPAPQRPGILWIGYGAIAALLLVRLAYGMARASGIRRRARREDGFLSSPECACPVTAGLWHPAIILPTTWRDWPPAELAAVLAHERAHVRRRDPLVQFLAALNRCVFWFHPLAWWLERRLAALAEEACDAAAVASGHDPHDYSEYLIHQARAVEQAGARIAIHGAAIGGGDLGRRIRLLLDAHPAPALSRSRGAVAATTSVVAIFGFTACRLAEKPAAGQPTMHELAEKMWAENRAYSDREKRIVDRAHSLTPDEARDLFAKFKQNPDREGDDYRVLLRYYEHKVDMAGMRALKLWLIEHQPAGKFWLNIDPRHDRAGYEQGKALWLAHLKKPNVPVETYRQAADYLAGGDKPLAGTILEEGRKAYPAEPGWPHVFGRHYAQVIIGSDEPAGQFNVVRRVSDAEASSAYAQKVRAQLTSSTDAEVLAQTAQYLLVWGRRPTPDDIQALAAGYVDRAHQLDPAKRVVQSMRNRVAEAQRHRRLEALRKMSPAELDAVPVGDRLLLNLYQMNEATYRKGPDDAAAKARDLLALAAQHPNEPLYGEIVFDVNIQLGKHALRRGDKRTAVRHLLAAAETSGSPKVRRGEFDMNLPRALVDWGERRAVIEFFQRIAPKSDRAKEFQDYAAELAKGINPDLRPTLSYPGCANDPC